jgi:phosphoglycolate phosphatase-like HAD superfamily hydrolase
MTLNQKILDVVIIFGLVLTLIAIPLSLISNTLPSNDRLFVFAQQVTDNTINTTPSTATVEGQRQGQSTSTTMTATSDNNKNNNNTLLLLPSWNEGDTKQTIINFVKNVTNPENPDYYITPDKRIAVFDNDGTLWSEKPIPFEGYFALDRLENLSIANPNLKQISPYKEFLQKNITALKQNLTEKDVVDLITITHSNISQSEFNNIVMNWSQIAQHPQTQRLFVNMVYQPQLELINFLKDNQFKVFIVSGGGIDFMRQSLSSVYGIPPEQIIGSSGKYEFVDNNNTNSFIFREPELNSFNNDYQKPVNIQLHIGKVPVIAVGNSDGDLQMLKYVDDNNNNDEHGKALMVLIHHDDAVREYSYDKGAENVLKEAQNRNWTVIDMKDDFRDIYPS